MCICGIQPQFLLLGDRFFLIFHQRRTCLSHRIRCVGATFSAVCFDQSVLPIRCDFGALRWSKHESCCRWDLAQTRRCSRILRGPNSTLRSCPHPMSTRQPSWRSVLVQYALRGTALGMFGCICLGTRNIHIFITLNSVCLLTSACQMLVYIRVKEPISPAAFRFCSS